MGHWISALELAGSMPSCSTVAQQP